MVDKVYTDEVVKDLVSRYVEAVAAGADYDERTALVKEMAEEIGMSEASVRSKLVREKVYVAKAVAKTAGGFTKEDLVKAFESITGKTLKSLGNAGRKDLQALWDFVTQTSDEQDANEQKVA